MNGFLNVLFEYWSNSLFPKNIALWFIWTPFHWFAILSVAYFCIIKPINAFYKFVQITKKII